MYVIPKPPSDAGNTEQNPKWRFFEPALIIAALTAELYVVGYESVASFFTKLGYNHTSLDLPTDFYLSFSIIPISIIFFVIAIPYVVNDSWGQHTRLLKLVWQLPFIFTAVAFAYQAARRFPNSISYFLGFLALDICAIVVIFLRQNYTLRDFILNSTLRFRITLVLMFFVLSFFLAQIWGEVSATRLIEADISTVGIEFKWKNQPPPELQGKDLILVMHRDQKYYAVAHEDPAPEHPKFYTIPDDLVDLVTTSVR
jgi:hypothetical protein